MAGETYTQSWEIKYAMKEVFDLAIQISNFGLFFLNVVIDEIGNLLGNVQIVNSRNIAQQFVFNLEVSNGQRGSCYKNVVRFHKVFISLSI